MPLVSTLLSPWCSPRRMASWVSLWSNLLVQAAGGHPTCAWTHHWTPGSALYRYIFVTGCSLCPQWSLRYWAITPTQQLCGDPSADVLWDFQYCVHFPLLVAFSTWSNENILRFLSHWGQAILSHRPWGYRSHFTTQTGSLATEHTSHTQASRSLQLLSLSSLSTRHHFSAS